MFWRKQVIQEYQKPDPIEERCREIDSLMYDVNRALRVLEECDTVSDLPHHSIQCLEEEKKRLSEEYKILHRLRRYY